MKTKIALSVVAALAVASATFIHFHSGQGKVPAGEFGNMDSSQPAQPPESAATAKTSAEVQSTPAQSQGAQVPGAAAATAHATNRLERLRQIETRFRLLAAGDPLSALRAAKEMSNNPVEREKALLTLVTEWTQGQLRDPTRRAAAIAGLGLEAGIGLELADHPDLAVLWANELTEGEGRTAVLKTAANHLVVQDPAAAFALADQIAEPDRRKFVDSLFADWGSADTDSALKWADQLPDAADREAAVAAIRTAAPVGIGTALKIEDGYPVVTQILPGTAAEKNGQIRPGDRIIGLAQGDSRFVDAHSVPLEQIVAMIRGAPNTMLQLQVVSADAPQNAIPRTVTIFRDQIRFKPQTQ